MLYIVAKREIPELNSDPNRPFRAPINTKTGKLYGRFSTFREADTEAGQLAASEEGSEFLIFKAVQLVRSAPSPIIREKLE